jgi:hypothetical protein
MKNFKIPKIHPIIWLMIVAAFTVYIWDPFIVVVGVYYILNKD